MTYIEAEIHWKRAAEVGMTNYNHEEFKKSHPTLLRVAIRAIQTAPKK